jgi:hypothetical protein
MNLQKEASFEVTATGLIISEVWISSCISGIKIQHESYRENTLNALGPEDSKETFRRFDPVSRVTHPEFKEPYELFQMSRGAKSLWTMTYTTEDRQG